MDLMEGSKLVGPVKVGFLGVDGLEEGSAEGRVVEPVVGVVAGGAGEELIAHLGSIRLRQRGYQKAWAEVVQLM